MIVDQIDFIKVVTQDFWKHISSHSYVPYTDTRKRTVVLKDLCSQINSGAYTPSIPREYVVSNKLNSVSRIVPTFEKEDYCVYFYCIKKLEEYLAVNRVEFTFGGYSLGGEIRNREDQETYEINEIPFSISPFSYNPLAWVEAWRDFQKKAYTCSRLDGEFKYFLKFDIANFYDTVNLNLLEKKVRLACPKEKAEIIDLLFYFLKYWNKKFLGFSEKNVGLPQDEVGDCSRILTNFYLQDYDQIINNKADKKGCLYLRYSDDQIFMCRGKEEAEYLLFEASKDLFKFNLNINPSKVVHYCSLSEWDYYWSFEIFDLLGDKENSVDLSTATVKFLKLDPNKCRYSSILTRLLNCNLNKIRPDLRIKLLSNVYDETFLSNCDARVMMRIYEFIPTENKDDFVEMLKNLSSKVLFNQYHYNLLKVKKAGLPIDFEDQINERINQIKL